MQDFGGITKITPNFPKIQRHQSPKNSYYYKSRHNTKNNTYFIQMTNTCKTLNGGMEGTINYKNETMAELMSTIYSLLPQEQINPNTE
eukprot:1214592-Ditylum_brightwellii.AAC.1